MSKAAVSKPENARTVTVVDHVAHVHRPAGSDVLEIQLVSGACVKLHLADVRTTEKWLDAFKDELRDAGRHFVALEWSCRTRTGRGGDADEEQPSE